MTYECPWALAFLRLAVPRGSEVFPKSRFSRYRFSFATSYILNQPARFTFERDDAVRLRDPVDRPCPARAERAATPLPPFSALTLRLSASIRLMTLLGFGALAFGAGLPACFARISSDSAVS